MIVFAKKIAVLCCLAWACSLWATVIFQDGKRDAVIVIAPEASDPIRLAAEQLSQYLTEATGAEWPIVTQPQPGYIPIFVGDSVWARENGFSEKERKPDGFLWKVTPDYILIAGHDYPGGPLSTMIHPQREWEVWNPDLKLDAFGEMGTYNGVCRFLERFVGVRWYMSGEFGTVVPKATQLDIPEMTERIAPDFEQRFAYLCDFPNYPDVALWYRRVGYGAPAPVGISHSYLDMLKFKDSHPEYFALIDGKRDTSNLSVLFGGNLCLSNEELLQAWVDHICDYFKAHPAEVVYPVCPMDGMVRICECPKCQAQLSPELGDRGKFSNYVWGFSDKVARAVAKRCPGKKVGTFAYEHYRTPPSNPQELAPNLVVMICYDRRTFYNPEEKAKIKSLLEAWSKRTNGLYCWTYPLLDYWKPWRGFPRFYPDILQEDIRANRAMGIRGGFLETEQGIEAGDEDFDLSRGQTIFFPGLSHLTNYITIKLLWDADTDVNALLEEYYPLFYGNAAEPMRKFWELAWHLTKTRLSADPVNVYKKEDIQQFFRYLDEAAAMVPPESVEARRIAMIRNEMEPYVKRLLRLNETKRPFVVPKVKGPLALNFDLLNSPWAQGERYKLFTQSGDEADCPTYVLGIADEKAIGITFLCFEPNMNQLVTKTTERDVGFIWLDDSVELFFCREDGSDGHQFIITAGGNLFDASWAKPDDEIDINYNAQIRYKVEKWQDRWVAQVIIPWSELGVSAAEADKLKVNLFRNRDAGQGLKSSAFSPSLMQLHRSIDYFGKIELELIHQ